MSFKNFQVITTVKNSFNYHAQTSESDLERLNCLSQWAIAHFSLTGIMSQLIEPFAIFCITHFLHRKLPQQPDSAGIGCLPQEAPGTSRHVCCLWALSQPTHSYRLRGLGLELLSPPGNLAGQSTGAAHPLGITCPFAKPQSSLEQSLLMLRAEMAPYWAPTAVLPRHSRRAWFWSGAEQLVRKEEQ